MKNLLDSIAGCRRPAGVDKKKNNNEEAPPPAGRRRSFSSYFWFSDVKRKKKESEMDLFFRSAVYTLVGGGCVLSPGLTLHEQEGKKTSQIYNNKK